MQQKNQPDKAASLEDILGSPTNLPDDNNINFQEEYANYKAKFEEISEDNFSLKEENSALKSNLRTKTELDKLIKPFAHKAYNYMCCYTLGVGIILLMTGLKSEKFSLPESVLKFFWLEALP